MKKNKPNKEHILKLIDFMYCEMCSSGGDGDGIWYTRYYGARGGRKKKIKVENEPVESNGI